MTVIDYLATEPPAADRERPRQLRVHTAEAWLLAASPVWITGVLLGVQLLNGTERLAGSITLFIGILLTALLTVRDRARLVKSGQADAASVGWWLLTPLVYLIIRSTRVGGWSVVVLHASLTIAVIAALVATNGAVLAR
jgi:hypothetical protein